MAKTGNQSRAVALSSGLGGTALVFEDYDVVDLLKTAIERKGSQCAVARPALIAVTVLTGRRAAGAAIAELVGLLAKAYVVK